MPNGYHRFRTSPLATIAMVTYNSGRFLREAIESVLAQDCDDFELLVCDDCSHDDSWDIVKSFDDRRIRAVRNDANLGEYLNRNKALGLARGKYIMYLDGDDILYPHGLGQLARTLQQFPRAAFAAGLTPCEKFIFPVELAPREYCSCAFLGPNVLANDFTQLFFRTEALRAIGGFDLRYRSGDTYIQFALGMRSHVVLTAGGLAWWRQRRGQASERMRANGESLQEMWRYCRELLEQPACPLDEREKGAARANLTRLLLRRSVRLMLRKQPGDAYRLAFETGIPLREWASILRPYEHPFLRHVTGDNPVRVSIDAGPPVTDAPRRTWRPVARLPQPRVLARRSTLELATPAE